MSSMKKSQRALYAQKSMTAEYGINKSHYHNAKDNEPRWTGKSALPSQDLSSQIPKSPKNKPKVSLSKEYKKKLIHEWSEGDVSSWLKVTLSSHFQSNLTSAANDDNMTNYIWAFNQKQVDGIFLIKHIDSKQDIIDKICIDQPNINDDVIKIIYKAIVKLRKKAKKQINNLHPMKQSNLDPEIRAKFAKTSLSLGAHKTHKNNNNSQQNGNEDIYSSGGKCGCLFFLKLTNNRFYRISIMAAMLLIFCVIEAIEFIPHKDYGGMFAMLLFLLGTIMIIIVIFKERRTNKYDDKQKYVKLSHGGGKQSVDVITQKNDKLTEDHRNDSDNEVEYDSDYREIGAYQVKRTWTAIQSADKEFYEQKKYTFSVGCGHVLAIIFILLGGIAWIASRWIVLKANTVDEWLYGFGIGVYIGGLCIMLVIDIAFLRLLDDHERRMLCIYSINFIYYFFVIGYYAINGSNTGLDVILGIMVILSSIVSIGILIIYSKYRWVIAFSRGGMKVILPFFVALMHIGSIVILIIEYKFKFYPMPSDEASTVGSVAFVILSSLFQMMITIDSRIFIL